MRIKIPLKNRTNTTFKNTLKALLFLPLLFCWTHLRADQESDQLLSYSEKQYRLKEIQHEIDALKKWQMQYLRTFRSFKAKSNRMQYKNSNETKYFRSQASEAKANADALQIKIDELEIQKQYLLD